MSTIPSQTFLNRTALNHLPETAGRSSPRNAQYASTDSAATTTAPASPQDLLAAMAQQNRAAAVAEITSVDLADAAVQFTKLSFQTSPNLATQSQANLDPQAVFRLLQG